MIKKNEHEKEGKMTVGQKGNWKSKREDREKIVTSGL